MVILNCKNGANKTATINNWLKMWIKVSRDANLVFASYIFDIDGNSEIFPLVTWIEKRSCICHVTLLWGKTQANINLEPSEISLKILAHRIPVSGGGRWRDGRRVASGYSFSDWWLLTDPCDCDWQALTTTPLVLASPHCWAQQVVWRLAEIPNKMDITGKNNSRPRGGECWARSTPPSHSVPGFTNSAPFQDCGI